MRPARANRRKIILSMMLNKVSLKCVNRKKSREEISDICQTQRWAASRVVLIYGRCEFRTFIANRFWSVASHGRDGQGPGVIGFGRTNTIPPDMSDIGI